MLDLFLRLTRYTVPHGYERIFAPLMREYGATRDRHGNYWVRVGAARTLFAAHLDTASTRAARVRHVITGDTVGTDGTTILGADAKAGVAVMLAMIGARVPGAYAFFVGEERGQIGSRAAAAETASGAYDRVISFDRRGTRDVITHQMGRRTASDAFACALCDQLNAHGLRYRPSDTGSYTDSEAYADIVPECTNISVGYDAPHTVRESQDMAHLRALTAACIALDWEALPTVRDPNEYPVPAPQYMIDAAYEALESELAIGGHSWSAVRSFVAKNPVGAAGLLCDLLGIEGTW